MKYLVQLILFGLWIFGIVLAKGFWSTLFAIIIPLWGYYLVGEYLFTRFG